MVKDALRQLEQRGRLSRQELEGRYLYCAAQRGRRQEQWAARQAQQRRLHAGLESLEWGDGGDQRMARLLGFKML